MTNSDGQLTLLYGKRIKLYCMILLKIIKIKSILS